MHPPRRKSRSLKIFHFLQDDNFLHLIHLVENVVSKLLSLALIGVIFVALFDLFRTLLVALLVSPQTFFGKTMLEIFGMFLNILIALELLENITAYLKKHVIQVELVIVTAMIAVARKLIIFDFSKYNNGELLSLGFASLCLGVTYWLIKNIHRQSGFLTQPTTPEHPAEERLEEAWTASSEEQSKP